MGARGHPQNSSNSLKTIEFSKGVTGSLTTGIDTGAAFLGGDGDDTYTATVSTLTPFDSLDGAMGTGDALTVSNVVTGATLLDLTNIGGLSIKGMESISLTSIAGATINTTGMGTTALSINNVTAGAVTATVESTTAVTATNTATAALTVVGGSTQTVSSVGGNVALSKATGAIVQTESAQAGTTKSAG